MVRMSATWYLCDLHPVPEMSSPPPPFFLRDVQVSDVVELGLLPSRKSSSRSSSTTVVGFFLTSGIFV